MDNKESLGQITAAFGRISLRFKNGPEEPLPQGQVFAKCAFVGRGESFFVPTPPAADGQAPPVVEKGAGSPQTLPLSVQSEPVDITEAVTSQTEQDEDNVGNDNVPTANIVVVDLGFNLDTAKFDLVEDVLSMLDATVINIELCLRHGGSGVGAEVETAVIGTASVRVAAILSGENEWTNELALGAYTASPLPDAENSEEIVAEESKEPGLTDNAAIHDTSSGLLEFGGSTSTIRVTLLANDDTADYTVGAGSLWTNGAEVTGVPEGWKVVPPPETERSAWNDAIAQSLSGQPRHEFSIWWGADPAGAPGDALEEKETVKEFPAMRLDGGILSYEPDEESVNVDSVRSESAADAGSQGQAPSPATVPGGGNGGGAGSTTSTDENPTPVVPRDPPTGTWSIRFPSLKAKSSFLHRTSIRELRQALTTPSGGGENQEKERETPARSLPSTSQLHVILERRELRPEPAADEGKAGGKGGKKGGGKKAAAGKKGEAAETPPPPAESPWRCRAVIDLAPLAQPAPVTPLAGRLAESDAGDSPLRAELRATLALAPPTAEDVPTEAAADDAAEKKTEESMAPAVATAAEGVKLDETTGESSDKPVISEVESRIEQMKAADTTLFLTFALSRPLMKARAKQDTTASVGDVFVPSDVGPRKPPRDVDVELKQELDEFVQASLEEYARLFLEPGADEETQDLSAQDREKRLFYALNSGGLYHSFLGRLKPRVQRIVRKRFGAVPADAAEADAFISDLYVHLVEEAAVVLNHRIKNVETKATPSYITADADKSLELKVEHLGMLADDAEARGAREEAAARHEDRIE
ncbi:unnamed protein product, partial [Ectocarpus fasciculatus]